MIPGLILVVAFFLGSLPFSAWVASSRGVNLREHGSGNVGATNVYRVLGWKPGLGALALDILKGLVAVYAARWALPEAGAVAALAGAAAVAGHMWTPFLGFRGGKGVATSLGAFWALAPAPTILALGVWLGLTLLGGWISLASMGAAIFLPLAVASHQGSLGPSGGWTLAISVGLASIVLWRHRGNVGRLAAGTEKPVWDRGKEADTAPPEEAQDG